MPRSVDETRRDFLLRLARGAAFAPPVMASVSVREVAGQGQGGGGGGGGGKGGGQSTTSSTVGSLSPTASTIEGSTFRLEQSRSSPQGAPWEPGRPGEAPPWSVPPPTQTGR